MSIAIAIAIGLLAGVAVLQTLQRDMVRLVVGLYLFWNAANLLFLAVTRVRGQRAPFLDAEPALLTDPLVQAFVLTAIVITFGFAAFLVALVIWLGRGEETLDVDEFRQARD